MIYTGYYARLNEYADAGLDPIAISGAIPDFYDLDKFRWWKFFAPSKDIFYSWKNGQITDEGYVARYISERLEVLDLEMVREKFKEVEQPILLCYEKEGFCHRHVLADWLRNLGYEVEEYL